MNNRKLITGILLVLVFVLSGVNSFAQDMKSKMKDKPEMAEMMKSPHHKMMMAYRQNTLTFATTLRDLAKDAANFDAESAKTMVNEIKRSSEMMDKVHQDHISKMKSEKKMDAEKMEKMAPMMEKMKKQKAELDEHIKALETSVEAVSVDTKEVEKHSAAIVEMLEGMKMGEQHKDKMKMDKKQM